MLVGVVVIILTKRVDDTLYMFNGKLYVGAGGGGSDPHQTIWSRGPGLTLTLTLILSDLWSQSF